MISPPGAGKSYLLEKNIMQKEMKKGIKCQRVDCSNDELVVKALSSILNEYFPIEGNKSLLVADEFHMLSKEHKIELIDWIMTRLHWLKVVLIGNRTTCFKFL